MEILKVPTIEENVIDSFELIDEKFCIDFLLKGGNISSILESLVSSTLISKDDIKELRKVINKANEPFTKPKTDKPLTAKEKREKAKADTIKWITNSCLGNTNVLNCIKVAVSNGDIKLNKMLTPSQSKKLNFDRFENLAFKTLVGFIKVGSKKKQFSVSEILDGVINYLLSSEDQRTETIKAHNETKKK